MHALPLVHQSSKGNVIIEVLESLCVLCALCG